MSGNHPGLSNNFSRSGEKFSWSKDNLRSIKNIISKYPKGREQSAVMPLLYLAQEQNNNWISIECIETIAETLNMPKIRVTEVATSVTLILGIFKVSAIVSIHSILIQLLFCSCAK